MRDMQERNKYSVLGFDFYSGGIIKWMLMLTLQVILSGCSRSWHVHREYEGPDRPIEEVAVLFQQPLSKPFKVPIIGEVVPPLTFVSSIDGHDPGVSRQTEIHFSPGKHSITVGLSLLYSYGVPITISHNFSKGQVYELHASLIADRRWSLSCAHWGSVGEVAPTVTKLRFADSLGWPVPPYRAPSHWQELVRRQKGPKNEPSEAITNRSHSQDRSGQPDTNVSVDKTAFQLKSNGASSHVRRGNAHYRSRQYSNAISEYNKALELDPDYAAAYYNRGNAYATLRKFQEAKRDWLKAIELEPALKPKVKKSSDIYKVNLEPL